MEFLNYFFVKSGLGIRSGKKIFFQIFFAIRKEMQKHVFFRTYQGVDQMVTMGKNAKKIFLFVVCEIRRGGGGGP